MKRVFRYILLTVLIASLLMLTGCWNYQELENRYVVSGIGVDVGQQGRRYHLTFEILDLASGAGGQLKSKVIESEGDTIADAVDAATSISDKTLYFSDCKIAVFSRGIAAEGLNKVLDWFNRDPKPRFTVQFFVSQAETAGELFKQEGQSTGGVISMQIANSMEAVSSGGSSVQMHLYDVDNILLGEGWDLALPCLKKSGQKNPSVIADGTAVFRGDKFIGKLDEEQTKDYMFLRNVMQSGILLVEDNTGEKDMALLVRKSQVSQTPQINGDKIKMKIKMKMECSFDEENSKNHRLLELGPPKVEELADSTLQKRISEIVRQVQTEFGCDIFGFGRKIYEENPKEWQKLKPSWQEKFRTVSVEVEPKISIVNAEFAQPKGFS